MKIAIMQPYFFPYIGYWQLMNAVDKYVIYDNIQYEKGGWINRNQILLNGQNKYITIPIKKGSDYLDVRDRHLSEHSDKEKAKILNLLSVAYKKAPQYENVFPLVRECLACKEKNLFRFIYNSNLMVKAYLGIQTEIIISSTIDIDHSLKCTDKVLAICEHLGATQYYNAIGGQSIYTYEQFQEREIELKFLKPNPIQYRQYQKEFVPFLSIIDVMMFNSVEQIQQMLQEYTLITST